MTTFDQQLSAPFKSLNLKYRKLMGQKRPEELDLRKGTDVNGAGCFMTSAIPLFPLL